MVFCVPVIFPLLLNEVANRSTKRLFQTIVYVPNFLSWVIIAGVFMDILSSNGMVNVFLGNFGYKANFIFGKTGSLPVDNDCD